MRKADPAFPTPILAATCPGSWPGDDGTLAAAKQSVLRNLAGYALELGHLAANPGH
jgi:hypothetical protein